MKRILHCPDDIAPVPSTLLIPDTFFSFFQKKKKQYGIRYYVHRLLASYSRKKFMETFSYKTEYQDKGLNLHRKNFRPWEEDWLKLKLIAGANGISVTMMFVVMMVWDMIDEENSQAKGFDGDPTDPIIVSYLFNPSILTYTKTLHFKT